jgi:multidrug efflux system membrane fusion protein
MMAVALAGAVAVWMLTGLGGADETPAGSASGRPAAGEAQPTADHANGAGYGARRLEGEAASASAAEPPRSADAARAPGVRVSVRRSKAEAIVRNVVVSGRTEPNRSVEIKAETEGRIVELGADRGAAVLEGEKIVSLDVRDRDALIEEAEALIAQNQLQYEAAKRLQGQQLIAEVQIAEAKARLVSAQTALERIQLDLARTTIVAPFDGLLEERVVELGDYVAIGDPVGQIVDNDPLIAVGEVSEREIGNIAVGTAGRAQLVNGETIEGTVRYVSPVADPNTRTFRIEVAIPNADNRLPAGMTAELRLPAAEIEAHFLSPALLTLDDAGNIGVKTVDDWGRVRFHEVEIVQSASDGVWVTGLPDEVAIITVGQGFVADGETVQAVPADSQ